MTTAGAWAVAAPAAAEPSLLLLPFVVHSAEDPEYLRAGLADMLAARFDRIGALELMRTPTSGKAPATTDLDEALAVARKAGADYVLYGSFTRFGRGASLDVHCAPTLAGGDREPLREIFVHSGSIGEIIPDLDELAGKVSRVARGEIVAASEATNPNARVAGAASGAELRSLRDRVAALEAAVAELREGAAEGVAGSLGSGADVR